MRNQPVKEIYGDEEPSFRDIGVKWKYTYTKQKNEEETMIIEKKDHIAGFLSQNHLYEMEGYEGIAEFDVANFDQYQNTGRLPFLRFSSHIAKDELLPIPEKHTLDYSELHWELERWTLFKSLPNLINFDKNMRMLLT